MSEDDADDGYGGRRRQRSEDGDEEEQEIQRARNATAKRWRTQLVHPLSAVEEDDNDELNLDDLPTPTTPLGARAVLRNPVPSNFYARMQNAFGNPSMGDEPMQQDDQADSEPDDNNDNGRIPGRPMMPRGADDFEGADMDEDLGRTRNEDMPDAEPDEIPIYYHVPTTDIAEVFRELGRPGPRHECFGCNYVGMNMAALIPDTRLKEVFQTMADGIGVCWPAALAVQVSRQFESWRTIVNKTRGERDRLPKWSPSSILDHWYNHTQDPEIQQWLDLCHLRYTMQKIRSSCLEKRNRFTGTEIHDREQWAIYRDAMRMWYTITRMEPRKMSFYSEGRMLDKDSVTNKGIYTKTRPVYKFFQKDKRMRTAADNRNRNSY